MTGTTSHPTAALRASRATTLTRLMRMGHRLRQAWTQRETLRAIESMPFEVRKDIGWPSSEPPCNPHRPS